MFCQVTIKRIYAKGISKCIVLEYFVKIACRSNRNSFSKVVTYVVLMNDVVIRTTSDNNPCINVKILSIAEYIVMMYLVVV